MNDPFEDRLSEYRDGDVDDRERREIDDHLTGCEHCRAVLSDLERIAESSRDLPALESERDLWPGIAVRIGAASSDARGSRHRMLIAAAALLLFGGVIGALLHASLRAEPVVAQYALLLHESEETDVAPQDMERVVARYRSWTQSLPKGVLASAEKLSDEEAMLLRPDGGSAEIAPGSGVGGYFLLDAESLDRAIELARGCPHLDLGGDIEVRRIERRR